MVSSKNSLLKAGVFEIVFVVLAIALFFGILNYFNIISLSTLYPNQFGSLPHQTLPKTPQKTPPPQSITFSCPVAKEFCSSGKEIYDGKTFLGIGYNLPVGTKIYAAISGNIIFGGAEDKERKILSHAKIVIGGTGENQGYSVRYDYFGLPISQNENLKQITRRDELGAVWGGNFPKEEPFNGINVLIKITTNTDQDVHVSQFE